MTKEISIEMKKLPEEILELENIYNEINKLRCVESRMTYEELLKNTIEDVEKEDTIIEIFLNNLLQSIRWRLLIQKYPEIAETLTDKLSDIVIKYSGYQGIYTSTYEEPYSSFWRVYIRYHSEDKYIRFIKKVTSEIERIIESHDYNNINGLLSNITKFFEFYNHMTREEIEESKKELERVIAPLINICITNQIHINCSILDDKSSLISIYNKIHSSELKNTMIKYIVGYTNYFQNLEMDNRECVINTVYAGENEKRDFFTMYLKNALELNRKELYSGEILEKVLNKLFRQIEVKRDEVVGSFGENSPEEFSNTLVSIEKLCNEPEYLNTLAESDFFEKLYNVFLFFILKYFRKQNPDSKNDYFNTLETSMKTNFFRLCAMAQKKDLTQESEFTIKP